MAVSDLIPWFSYDEIQKLSEEQQIEAFYKVFKEDFLRDDVYINGKRIKIILSKSKMPDFKQYEETFAHIITRELKSQKDRFYEQNRANRIHWIKEILTSPPCNDIKYFKAKDDKGICKEYYWLIHKAFIVVLKNLSDDVQIVTAFCVDEEEKLKYFELYKNYGSGKSEC